MKGRRSREYKEGTLEEAASIYVARVQGRTSGVVQTWRHTRLGGAPFPEGTTASSRLQDQKTMP